VCDACFGAADNCSSNKTDSEAAVQQTDNAKEITSDASVLVDNSCIHSHCSHLHASASAAMHATVQHQAVQTLSPSNTCAGAAVVVCPEPQHVRLLSVAAVPDLHVGVVEVVSSGHVHLVAVRARCMRAPAQKPLAC
jgi:hypothetical protein